jgi:hypothetical protein
MCRSRPTEVKTMSCQPNWHDGIVGTEQHKWLETEGGATTPSHHCAALLIIMPKIQRERGEGSRI